MEALLKESVVTHGKNVVQFLHLVNTNGSDVSEDNMES